MHLWEYFNVVLLPWIADELSWARAFSVRPLQYEPKMVAHTGEENATADPDAFLIANVPSKIYLGVAETVPDAVRMVNRVFRALT